MFKNYDYIKDIQANGKIYTVHGIRRKNVSGKYVVQLKIRLYNQYEGSYFWINKNDVLRHKGFRDPYKINAYGGYHGVDLDDTPCNLQDLRYISAKWWHILMRAGNHCTYRQCYTDVNVCNSWLNFSRFKTWCLDVNRSNYKLGFHIDKDLFSYIKNVDPIYSPETAVFLPPFLNYYLSSWSKHNNIASSNSSLSINVNNNRVNFKSKDRLLIPYYRYYTFVKIVDRYLELGQINHNIWMALNVFINQKNSHLNLKNYKRKLEPYYIRKIHEELISTIK